MRSCIQSLAADLTEAQRAASLLHDGYGLTNPEIARVLGCSVAAVKIRLHRARGHMARLVEQGCTVAQDARGVLVCEPHDASTNWQPE
jgi:RNA polymerase sigma-70 factor (ECF subfamily)